MLCKQNAFNTKYPINQISMNKWSELPKKTKFNQNYLYTSHIYGPWLIQK